MDRHGGCSTAAKATGVERCVLAKKTLGLLALVSFFSLLYSYLLGLSSYHNIQFSTLIFSLFAHSIDRKFMFFICNGIVAFLVKNLNFSSSAGFINNAAEDGVDQTTEMPPAAATMLVQQNAASVEYDIISTAVAGEEEETEECGYDQAVSKPTKDELEEEGYRAVSEPAEDELEEEEEEEEEVEENKGEEGTATVEEVNHASVSTEELNHKCEEFIRKMKEEIRIEAQQQVVTV